MLKSLIGSKVGMTRLFDSSDKCVVPVTAVVFGPSYVTQIKSSEKDGYFALQVGIPRSRYSGMTPTAEWFSNKAKFFRHIREISVIGDESKASTYEVGKLLTLKDLGLVEGGEVKLTSTSKALGFQGVVKRHGFAGGPGGHGSRFHRRPGASSCLRKGGELWKGKRMAGRMGGETVTVSTSIVKLDDALSCVFVKGSVPGKSGFFVKLSRNDS